MVVSMKLPSGIPKPVDTPSGRKFKVQYKIAGRLRSRTFDNIQDAAEHQRNMKAQLIQFGKAFDIVLSPKERADVLTTLQEIEQHGTTLARVWKFYQDYNRAGIEVLSSAFKTFLAHKKRQGMSPQTLRDYRMLEDFFAKVGEDTPVGLVRMTDLEKWIRNKSKSTGSFLKYKAMASGFWNWCVKRGYCEQNIAACVEAPRYVPKTPVAIPVEDIRRILDYVREGRYMFPYLVIALYGGLRREEILRLSWDDFNFEEGHIVLDSKQTKTRRRRVVKLLGNAAEALKPYTRCQVVPKNSLQKLTKIQEDLGIKWGRDGLRHTASAHMLNHYKSADEAALQLGNSASVIRSHYQAVATDKDTETFLSLL